MAIGLLALGNVPVYSMIAPQPTSGLIDLGANRNDTTSPAQVLKELNLPAVAVESYSGYALDILPDAQQGDWSMRVVQEDESIASILDSMGLGKTAQALLKDTATIQPLQSMKAGSRLLFQVVDGSLEQVIYSTGGREVYIISPTDQGYTGNWKADVFEARQSSLAFTVQHSLQRDGKAAGLSGSLIRQLAQVFQKDMDFKRGVKAGDSFGVIFEDFRYQGSTIYTDKVLAAEYHTGKKVYQRIRFQLADGTVGYFDPSGDAEVKRAAFDRKPVDGIMSSGFGMRRHPVFGLRRSHTGVDFAAPHGTPIRATADGAIKFIGRQGGYGNVVELAHGNGITTLYGHMSAFKDGLANGMKVKRGEVIGYVGSTGTSTGNHVHYEFSINDVPQNPLTVELPKTGVMADHELRQFKALAAGLIQQLANVRKLAATGQAAGKETGG